MEQRQRFHYFFHFKAKKETTQNIGPLTDSSRSLLRHLGPMRISSIVAVASIINYCKSEPISPGFAIKKIDDALSYHATKENGALKIIAGVIYPFSHYSNMGNFIDLFFSLMHYVSLDSCAGEAEHKR